MKPEQIAQLLFSNEVEIYCYAAIAIASFFIGLLIVISSTIRMHKREKEV